MRHPYAAFVAQGREARPLPRRRVPVGAQGSGDRSTRRVVPRVPRRLRHRDEPPRAPRSSTRCSTSDPRIAVRARVRAVGRHGGRAARARPAAGHRSRARGRCRDVRRRRLLAAVRADLHQHADACSTSAASRCARPIAATTRPAGHRRRADGDAPRADGAVLRRLLHRRGRGGAARRSLLAWTRDARAPGVPRARARWPRSPRAGRVYVPSLYATAIDADTGLESWSARRSIRACRRAVARALRRRPRHVSRSRRTRPVPYAEAIFDRVAVEIARGCTEGCRFCQAGMIYRPVRERDPDAIVDTVVERRREGRLRRDRR